MTDRLSHSMLKKELLRDIAVSDAYNDLEEEYQLIRQMLRQRKAKGLTQSAVAEVMHTTPSVISRIESMHLDGRPSPSLATLKKYAHALGCRLHMELLPEDNRPSDIS